MIKTNFLESAGACLENGRRLTENADLLAGDPDTVAVRYALAFLAQEEVAKAFLLYLVYCDALPWNRYVQRSLKDHTCKQLQFIVMDALDPDMDEVFANLHLDYFSSEAFLCKVGDALNWYRYAKIEPWTQGYNDWNEDPFNESVRKISEGKLDKKKQNALYVSIGKEGHVTSTPASIKATEADAAMRTAKRFHSFVSDLVENRDHYNRKHVEWLKQILKSIFTPPLRTGRTRNDLIPGVEIYEVMQPMCDVPKPDPK